MKNLKRTLLAIAIGALSVNASADLAQKGPINPATGYPKWYQDENGLVLDLCMPSAPYPNQSQQSACLLTGIGIDPPYSIPGNFPDEAFYWRGTTVLDTSGPTNLPGTLKAVMVMALESAFVDSVSNGQQAVFTRIRVVAGLPQDGNYIAVHPYGKEFFPDVIATGKRDIVFSEDVGIGNRLDFNASLTSRLGPFLSPANADGTLKPYASLNGAEFLSDGLSTEFLRGSPFDTNFVLICGKDASDNEIQLGTTAYEDYKNCAFNDQFTLTGRLHNHVTDPIATPLTLSDTSYSRDNLGTYIDINALLGRQIKTDPVPVLTVGHDVANPVKMVGPDSKNKFYAQLRLPATDKPGTVTVTNSAVSPSVSISTAVKDVVKVLSADFNPLNNNLIIDATSSDKGDSPPDLRVLGYNDQPTLDQVDHSIRHFQLLVGDAVPPDFVTVLSNAGGRATIKVDKGLDPDKYSRPGVPFAKNDTVDPDILVDSSAIDIDVLTNDLGTIDATTLRLVPIKTANLGVASIVDNKIHYVPGSIAGEDVFTYSVGNRVGQSNVANVTVNIDWSLSGPKPTALPDGPFSNTAGIPNITIPIGVLLTNDKSNDLTTPSQYALDPTSVVVVAGSTTVGTAEVVGTNVIYKPNDASANTGGSFGFDYTVTNTKGNVSNPARVGVNVAVQERITAVLTCKSGKWSGAGTSSARINNKMTVSKVVASVTPTLNTISSGLVVNATTGAWTLPGTTGPACTGVKGQTTAVSIVSSYGTIFKTTARNN
ncbi:MAG: hypothetical protein NTU70_05310 [Methylococcales bacterium]|nr:hypothetical protein [Methylococcales bacterium]